ncbi:MAG TPA: porin family protein [Bacteroidales bacterium]|nr:porin family protein [Bacteroidales bacterium]HPD23663.1 porin family protein [Bacteroidales bacterium]HRS99684.1 porin family protein [Bacteroidales bacterium]HRT80190.1 porin family protein [Bacteroidales bacterium]
MKKNLVVIVFLALSVNIFAQKVSGGLFGGTTLSWLSTDSKMVDPQGVKFGYTYGAVLDLNLTDNFAFTLGVRLNNTGGSANYPNGLYKFEAEETVIPEKLPASTKINYNLNYLAIPVGIKGKTNEIGYFKYYLTAGATPMIRAKAKASFGIYENEVVNKEINSFNIGWNIGGGAEYSLVGNTRLMLEIVYMGGLIDFDKTEIFTEPAQVNVIKPKTVINDVHLKLGILF